MKICFTKKSFDAPENFIGEDETADILYIPSLIILRRILIGLRFELSKIKINKESKIKANKENF